MPLKGLAPSTSTRKLSKSKRYTICSVLAIVLLIVIIVPLAVLLPRRHHHNHMKANVIVPLYIYPSPGAWDPLYTAIETHPSKNFTLIINPASGPGTNPLPDSNFTSALTKLNQYTNVQNLGYVHVSYGNRTLSDVVADIKAYAGWGNHSASIAVQGIFVDEAPGDWTSDVETYMNNVNAAVKSAGGIEQPSFITHNIGTIPDSRLWQNDTDVTVVFEGSYSYLSTQQATLKALHQAREKQCYMVYGSPGNGSNLTSLVDESSLSAGYLFVTDLAENYYESWGSNWVGFVNAVPT